jgi:hypothetical protein
MRVTDTSIDSGMSEGHPSYCLVWCLQQAPAQALLWPGPQTLVLAGPQMPSPQRKLPSAAV